MTDYIEITRSVRQGCSLSALLFILVMEDIAIHIKKDSSCKNNSISKQDAREAMRVVFSVLTKRICMHKTNFLRIYSNIVLKVILNCMNMQIATQLIMMYNL